MMIIMMMMMMMMMMMIMMMMIMIMMMMIIKNGIYIALYLADTNQRACTQLILTQSYNQ